MVVNEAVGAPLDELPVPVAPMAPDPPVPDVSTPVKLTTVMVDATLCDSLAVTDTFETVVAANARQISAVPRCVLVRLTSDQLRLPPLTLLTVTLEVDPSVETNASSSSFALVVVKVGEVMLLPDVWLVETVWSSANGAVEAKFTPVTLAPLTVTGG